MLLHEKLKPYRLMLASRSPRRRQLLEDAGFSYTLAPDYDVEERYPAGMPAREVPVYLAQLKSEGYPGELLPMDIIITADTVVLLDDDIIGKPDGHAGAVAMLERLSGREHTVITGVTLRTVRESFSFDAVSRVSFKSLSREEIDYYIDTYKPYDKAGSYGIQEWIGYIGITGIEGSFYNVMGLPVQKLYTVLNQFIGS